MIPDFFANLHDFEQKGGIKYNIKYTSKTDDGDPSTSLQTKFLSN